MPSPEDLANEESSLKIEMIDAAMRQLLENDKENYKNRLETARAMDIVSRLFKAINNAILNTRDNEKLIILCPPSVYDDIKRSLVWVGHYSFFPDIAPSELLGQALIVTNAVKVLTFVFERPIKHYGDIN